MDDLYADSREVPDRTAVLPGTGVERDAAKGWFKIKLWHLLLVALVILAVLLFSAPEQPVFQPICACLKP
jgi:hypothetical protein